MNRSEELAKLLRIEPKVYIFKKCSKMHTCGVLEEEPPAMKYVCDRCTIKDIVDVKHEYYPDFTKPDNFVKLLELKKDKYNNTILRFMLCWFGHSELEDLYNREDIIDKIIDLLSSEDYQKSETLIKNAQQTEWTY